MDDKVKAIYNDCWKIYREYTTTHDMTLYNQRNGELVQKYRRDNFLVGILYSFAPVVNALHAEYLGSLEKRKK